MYKAIVQNIHKKRKKLLSYNKRKKLRGSRRILCLIFAPGRLVRSILGSLCLLPGFNLDRGSKKGLIHQLLVPDLLEVATGGNVQMSVKKFDLFEGLVKSLSRLLGLFLFEVPGILHLGVKRFFELGHLVAQKSSCSLNFFFRKMTFSWRILSCTSYSCSLAEYLSLAFLIFSSKEWIFLA